MTDKYILEGKTPRPVGLMEWAKWYETANRHVGRTEVEDVKVSTVFLGMDHRFNDMGPPVLFETMIFGGEHDGYQERCSTWGEAEAMHTAACKLAGLPSPFDSAPASTRTTEGR